MIKHKTHFSDLIPNSNIISGMTNRTSSLETALTECQINLNPIILMNQVHSDQSQFIQESTSKIIPKTDAMFTISPKIVLTVKMADCLPILFYHPKPLIGVIHAGRKGTELEITKKTLLHIQEQFNLNKDFSFWFGPCICYNCYQIDADKNLHYDLIQENLKQLEAIGLNNKKRIFLSNECTYCKKNLFYSYRRGDRQLRNFAFIAIN